MTKLELEDFARKFFNAVDQQDVQGLIPYLSQDVRLQMANMPDSLGINALVAAFEATEQRFSAIRHDIQGIYTGTWTEGDVVSVEATAHYKIGNDRDVSLPVTSTLRINGEGKISDYRIFMDPTPAFADA